MADEPERDDDEQTVEISKPFGIDAIWEPDDWEPPRRICRVVALDDEGREVPRCQRSIAEL
jgi:hypothetical protein